MAKIKPKRTLIRSTNVNRTSKWSDSISFLAKNAATPKRKRKEIKGDEEEDEEEEEGDDDDDDDEERERERERELDSIRIERTRRRIGRRPKREATPATRRSPTAVEPNFLFICFLLFFFLGFLFQVASKSSEIKSRGVVEPFGANKTR